MRALIHNLAPAVVRQTIRSLADRKVERVTRDYRAAFELPALGAGRATGATVR